MQKPSPSLLHINIYFYVFNAKPSLPSKQRLPTSFLVPSPPILLLLQSVVQVLGCAEPAGRGQPGSISPGLEFPAGAVPGAVAHFLTLCVLFLQRCCGRRWPSCRRRSTCSGK